MKRVLSLIMVLSLLCSGFVYANEDCVPCGEISLGEFNISTSTDIGQLRNSIRMAFNNENFIKALSEPSYRIDMNLAEVYTNDELNILSIAIKSKETGEWIGNFYNLSSLSIDSSICYSMHWEEATMITTYYLDDTVIVHTVEIGEPNYSASSVDPNCVMLCNAIVGAGGCAYFCSLYWPIFTNQFACFSACDFTAQVFCANTCSSTAPPYIPSCGLIGLPDCNK